MPRRKEKGRRSAPQVDRIRFEQFDGGLRDRLAAGADLAAGSRELRRRLHNAQRKVA